MTLLIALLLEWKFGLIDFTYSPISSCLFIGGTLVVWVAHVFVKILIHKMD